jgi:hypothetical protein
MVESSREQKLAHDNKETRENGQDCKIMPKERVLTILPLEKLSQTCFRGRRHKKH